MICLVFILLFLSFCSSKESGGFDVWGTVDGSFVKKSSYVADVVVSHENFNKFSDKFVLLDEGLGSSFQWSYQSTKKNFMKGVFLKYIAILFQNEAGEKKWYAHADGIAKVCSKKRNLFTSFKEAVIPLPKESTDTCRDGKKQIAMCGKAAYLTFPEQGRILGISDLKTVSSCGSKKSIKKAQKKRKIVLDIEIRRFDCRPGLDLDCLTICPANHYCDNHEVYKTAAQKCPEHGFFKRMKTRFMGSNGRWTKSEEQDSTSPPGTKSLYDCICKKGYFIKGSTLKCLKCSEGSFCPGDSKKHFCPAGQWSDSFSTECLYKCGNMNSKYEDKDYRNNFCPGDGNRHTCPENKRTFYDDGAVTGGDCVCKGGMYKLRSGKCKYCPKDHYCSKNKKRKCSKGRITVRGGRWSVDSCRCEGGKYWSKNRCWTCPQGYYCKANDKIKCPAGTSASKGSWTVNHCT